MGADFIIIGIVRLLFNKIRSISRLSGRSLGSSSLCLRLSSPLLMPAREADRYAGRRYERRKA